MSAFDLLDDSFPHGTVDGHRRGCRGATCPAPLACRDVKRRYDGDYGFKRQVDAGVSLVEILRRDAAERDGIEKRDRDAARAAAGKPPVPVRKPKPTDSRRKPAPAPRPNPETPPPAPVLDPVAEFERDRDDWRARRRELRAAVREAERAIAEATQRAETAREHLTAHAELEPVKPSAPKTPIRASRSDTAAAVARLHAQQMTDAAIAAELGVTRNYVCTLRKEQGLEVHRAPRARRATSPRAPRELKPREVLGHGTNASYARGCRCDDCKAAAREYHRQWMENRRSAADTIPTGTHGTPYGYQLGCRGRHTCPAEISCTDASLAEERRRRREAGAPEAAPRVDAEPVRQHVRALMAAGMAVLTIADVAGVSKTGLKVLLYGRSGERKGEYPAHIEADKAQRILEVTAA